MIDFIELTGTHSGVNMAKEAFKTLEDLDIKEKVRFHHIFRTGIEYRI